MDFDERYFICGDGRLRTPITLSGTLSSKKAQIVPPKKIMQTGTLKRLKGDTETAFPFARKLDFT